MQRKLTVIFSADVVGYSGLMERDEAGTLARLKENRASLFDPRVAAHGGRIFKLMGDGVLIEFPSAAAAVTCALEIQQAMEASEIHRAEPERLRYRVGINLGDVIIEGDDIYGEGVNVAARLQALAPVGGIAVARNVSDQVGGKVPATFEDLGEHTVKNIARPVHVFTVRAVDGAPAPKAATAEQMQRLAVCVLPFVNMSGESEQEYFADGISEDIITDLSKVSALSVVSRNSSFMYKGRHVDLPKVARELKVSHVLEGSVRKSGGRVRITAQLIDGATNDHVWAERYDRELNDIFALQDEISEAIVKALKLKLLPEEKKAIEKRETSNAEVYELFLLARQFHRTGSERMKPLIVRLCKRAVAIDPGFARAWALMANSEAEASQRSVPGLSLENAREAAQRAITLDPMLAESHAALGEVLIRGEKMDMVGSEGPIEMALKLDPHCYDAHLLAGYLRLSQKRYHDAIRHFETAASLDPGAFRPLGMAQQCHEAVGDTVKLRHAALRCLECCEKLLQTEPDHGGALGFVVTALVHLGEGERARAWARRAMLFDPENTRLQYNIACGLATLGDADMALEMLETLAPVMPRGWYEWMQSDNSLNSIRSHPRYKAMIDALASRKG